MQQEYDVLDAGLSSFLARVADDSAARYRAAGYPAKEQYTLGTATFVRATDNKPVQGDVEWPDMALTLSQHEQRHGKDGPLWSPARYREGATRSKDSVEEVCALALDYDHAAPPWHFFAGFEYVAYTTHSHTDDAPRWRVVLPLAQRVAAANWPDFTERVVHHFGSGMDTAALKDASRMYYLPSCPPDSTPKIRINAGVWLDPDMLPALPEPVVRTVVQHIERSPEWPDGWLQSAVSGEAGEVAKTREPGRNDRLNVAAYNLGQLVGAGALGEEVAESALYDAAIENGLVSDDGEYRVRATIRSGLNAGIRNPRRPPARSMSRRSTPECSSCENLKRTLRAFHDAICNPLMSPVARIASVELKFRLAVKAGPTRVTMKPSNPEHKGFAEQIGIPVATLKRALQDVAGEGKLFLKSKQPGAKWPYALYENAEPGDLVEQLRCVATFDPKNHVKRGGWNKRMHCGIPTVEREVDPCDACGVRHIIQCCRVCGEVIRESFSPWAQNEPQDTYHLGLAHSEPMDFLPALTGTPDDAGGPNADTHHVDDADDIDADAKREYFEQERLRSRRIAQAAPSAQLEKLPF